MLQTANRLELVWDTPQVKERKTETIWKWSNDRAGERNAFYKGRKDYYTDPFHARLAEKNVAFLLEAPIKGIVLWIRYDEYGVKVFFEPKKQSPGISSRGVMYLWLGHASDAEKHERVVMLAQKCEALGYIMGTGESYVDGYANGHTYSKSRKR